MRSFAALRMTTLVSRVPPKKARRCSAVPAPPPMAVSPVDSFLETRQNARACTASLELIRMDLARFPRRRYTHAPTPIELLPHFTKALAASCPGGVGPE